MIKTSAAALAEHLQHVPKIVLFGAAAFIQFVLLALMVADRVQILREGTEVTLQTRPVDPRDVLRGDYVTLSYNISSLPAGLLKDQPAGARNPIVFVKLAPNSDGIYEAISAYAIGVAFSVHADPVPAVNSPEVLIRGRVAYGATCGPTGALFCDRLQIRYNIESYFVPEGEGRKLEQVRDQRKLMVVAAVDPSGRAAIKRLLVDGEAVYDEPWF
jgi:uncharacterized membrane-anchored protein